MLPALHLIGPTASGKSALALRLIERLAQRNLRAEIISVDSAQVFRDMNIGTAKPTELERALIPHHLIDLISPEEAYSAGQFRTDALRLIADIRKRGAIPLLVGGTMMYFNVLWRGIHDSPSADPALRARIEARAQDEGWAALHAELTRLDPHYAARINPNDRQRIGRAFELIGMGQLPSQALDSARWNNQAEGAPGSINREAYAPSASIFLLPDNRASLRATIGKRWHTIWQMGLWDEFLSLRQKYRLHPQLPSQRCVGYRVLWSFADSAPTLADTDHPLHERAIIDTAQLAKRQTTWMRGFIRQAKHNADEDFCVIDSTALSAEELLAHAWHWLQPHLESLHES